MASDLSSLLEMFKVGPTEQDKRQAFGHALGRMGMGILAANRSGPTLEVGRPSLGNMLGQGGLLGMDAYQNQLKYLQDERKAGGLAALQAMQIKKMMDQQAALGRLGSMAFPQQDGTQPPAPVIEPSLGGPVTVAAVGNNTPIPRPLDAPPPPAQGGYQPIPISELAKAAAANLDIKPWIALNNEARPDVLTIPLGNKIRVIDKKTLKVLEEHPIEAAPGSRSFEASDMTPEQYRQFLLDKGKASATTIHVGPKEADKKFAEEYIAFATGGFADTQAQLTRLKEVSTALQAAIKGGGTITGPVAGNLPDWARSLIFPKSQAAKEAVEEVVQRNLRLVLGAQFTEEEGKRLVSRAYNPALGEEENLKRVNRLIKQIEDAAQAKLDASRYFMQHGTLQGWQGKVWTMRDFNPEKGDTGSSPGWGIRRVQ